MLLTTAILLATTVVAVSSAPQFAGRQTNDCPNANQVATSINNYINDVTQVNSVIDNNSPTDDPNKFQSAVNIGLFFESDETI